MPYDCTSTLKHSGDKGAPIIFALDDYNHLGAIRAPFQGLHGQPYSSAIYYKGLLI